MNVYVVNSHCIAVSSDGSYGDLNRLTCISSKISGDLESVTNGAFTAVSRFVLYTFFGIPPNVSAAIVGISLRNRYPMLNTVRINYAVADVGNILGCNDCPAGQCPSSALKNAVAVSYSVGCACFVAAGILAGDLNSVCKHLVNRQCPSLRRKLDVFTLCKRNIGKIVAQTNIREVDRRTCGKCVKEVNSCFYNIIFSISRSCYSGILGKIDNESVPLTVGSYTVSRNMLKRLARGRSEIEYLSALYFRCGGSVLHNEILTRYNVAVKSKSEIRVSTRSAYYGNGSVSVQINAYVIIPRAVGKLINKLLTTEAYVKAVPDLRLFGRILGCILRSFSCILRSFSCILRSRSLGNSHNDRIRFSNYSVCSSNYDRETNSLSCPCGKVSRELNYVTYRAFTNAGNCILNVGISYIIYISAFFGCLKSNARRCAVSVGYYVRNACCCLLRNSKPTYVLNSGCCNRIRSLVIGFFTSVSVNVVYVVLGSYVILDSFALFKLDLAGIIKKPYVSDSERFLC